MHAGNNVGQFALDIILNKLHVDGRLRKEGAIESIDMLPVTGYETFGTDVSKVGQEAAQFLVQPLEVYSCEDSFVFIQVRSSCVQGRLQNFCQELLEFLNSESISKLVILTGARPNDLFETAMKATRLFHVGENFPIVTSTSQEISEEFAKKISGMPLAGCIYDFSRKAESRFTFGAIIVGKFCAEGDNTTDGISLAAAVSVSIGLIKESYFSDSYKKVCKPLSWNALTGAHLRLEQQRIGAAIYY